MLRRTLAPEAIMDLKVDTTRSLQFERSVDKHPSKQKPVSTKAPGDIKPATPVATFRTESAIEFAVSASRVAPLVGMSTGFIRKVVGKKATLTAADVRALLDQDSFAETFVPRSKILQHLCESTNEISPTYSPGQKCELVQGNALEKVASFRDETVQCVVTSTPYWAMRLYDDMAAVKWADGEECIYGLEQTPEAFVRHSVEIIYRLSRVVKNDGSIWWNIMDTFNTRTQIRGNAAEALRAMQGKETRGWKQYDCRRYSAGHSYLKDGEQCLIPFKIAERVSRLGLYVKSVICWSKISNLPEPQDSRVSRSIEYILHIAKCRAPYFDKAAYKTVSLSLGGRNPENEPDKLTDSWSLPTSSGRDGHGAQFPLSLPGRCIALSTAPDDVVLDPFVGSGTSAEAALRLGRRFVGIDLSNKYLDVARKRVKALDRRLTAKLGNK